VDNKPRYELKDLLADKTMTTSKTGDIVGLFGGGMTMSIESILQNPQYLEQVRTGKVKPPPGWNDKEKEAV
jgi:hypothetical protein